MFQRVALLLLLVMNGGIDNTLAAPARRLHVLAVGVDTSDKKDVPGDRGDTQDENDMLGYYADDAEAIAYLLQKKDSSYYSAQGERHILRGRDATCDEVVRRIRILQRVATADDTLVVVFSVHGIENDRGDDLNLSLADRSLTGKELLEQLVLVPGRVAVLMDTCRAGAILRQMDVEKHASIAMLLATQRNEDSSGQSPDGKIRHGYFVNALREGLLGLADDCQQLGSEGNNDKIVTLRELGCYALPRASQIYPRQTGVFFPPSGLPSWPLVSYRETNKTDALNSRQKLYCSTRNPWCDPDVIDASSEMSRRHAIKVTFPDPATDENAKLWPAAPILTSMPKTLGGEDWVGRWKAFGAHEWTESRTVKMKVNGASLFIQFDDSTNAYLFEVSYVGTDRLAGRYHNVRRTTHDYGCWTGRVVDFDRIDGIFADGSGPPSGRWDFRRKVQEP